MTPLPEDDAHDNPHAVRQAADREGRAYEQYSDVQLVGLASWHEQDRVRRAAAAELQRRLMRALRAMSDSADAFAEEMRSANRSIRLYTIALFVLAILQFVMMLRKAAS